MHSNCRGFPSKAKSIESIVSNMKVQELTLNEINLRKNRKLIVRGFKSFNRNREEGHMGGVATCVAEVDSDQVLKVTEGKEGNEFIITRHNQFVKPINVINVYGDVESRTSVDVIDDKWSEILIEIDKIEARGEDYVCLGDMNKHVGNIIPHNHEKTTHGGKLINELLDEGKCILVNSTDKTIGGPFSRYSPEDPEDDNKKSALDLVIVSENLFKYVEKLEIDKDLRWTPSRVTKGRLKYSDHYSLLLMFKGIPKKMERVVGKKKPIIWNTKKPGCWEEYYKKTNDNPALENAVETEKNDPNKLMKNIKKKMTSLKYKCFGKVSLKMVSEEEKNVIKLQKEKTAFKPG